MEYNQQRPAERQIGRRGPPHADYHGSRLTHRPVDPRLLVDENRYNKEFSHHGDVRRRKSEKVNFRQSVVELHDLLRNGLRFYQSFKTEFERDTQRIVAYTEQDLLDHLWISKIAKSAKRHAGDRGNRGGEEDRDGSKSGSDMTFASIASDIKYALHSTLDTVKRVSQPEDTEIAYSVGKKLSKMYKEIIELAKTASQRVRYTKQLMIELEMLLTFLRHNGAGRDDHRDSEEAYSQGQSGDYEHDDDQQRAQYEEEGSGDGQPEEGF